MCEKMVFVREIIFFDVFQGKIISIDGSMITIMPKHEDLKDPLVFQANELKKYFKMGDHVKVLSGDCRKNSFFSPIHVELNQKS